GRARSGTGGGDNVDEEQAPTFGRQVAELAKQHPDKAAAIFLPIEGRERTLSWRQLDLQSNQYARLLADRGVSQGTTVVVGLWNSPEHILLTTAAWKLGALMLPLRAILPKPERDGILALAEPALVCADWDDVPYPTMSSHEMSQFTDYDDGPLSCDPPHPGKAIASGGSTGHSKIIVDRTANPCIYGTRASRLGARHGQVQLVCAPLYHNSPFLSSFGGLADDHTLVIMEKFNAARAVDAIEQHRVNYAYMPPIIMRRIMMLPGVRERDFSSIEAIQSSAAPCPVWLKQAWIDLIGAEKVHEVYGSSEGIGATMIRGDEWLEHQGSVGRPVNCELRILGEDGGDLPVGEVGEIFMRTLAEGGPTFNYVGDAKIKSTPDGFLSIGDLGYVDEDSYLYIADRRTDMIVSGGANVYPAEVEAAFSDHPAIGDLAVIGVPDDDWGKRVHAVIEAADPDNPPVVAELDAYVRERLTSYKAPKTYEIVASLPRNEAGKIRRSDLAAERASGWTEGMVRARE
ncbi:MAG: AMP-binding protein, partial [Chloroflexota bacterium]|nr:AMP-binding protein [Chloroflexota bacterium]